MVRTLFASNPGSTCPSAIAVRIRRAEPIRRVRASATSLTTRIDLVLFWRNPPLPVRPALSLSVPAKSVPELWRAGISPKSRPVPTETARVKLKTRQSSGTSEPFSPIRGRFAVLTARSTRMPTVPSSKPSPPPTRASTTLSVRTWRAMRQREPPSAVRMATSRLRLVARTRSRLATLAQAISSTKPTAPTSTSSDWRTRRTSTSPSRSTSNPFLASPSAPGNWLSKTAREACTRARACGRVTPGFSRPATRK